MSKHDLLQEFYDTVWSGGDSHAIRKFFAPGAEASGLVGEMSLDAEDMIAFVDSLSMHVVNIEFELLHVLEDGDWVSSMARATGTSRRSGKPLQMTGQTLVRLEGGLIAEAHNHFDMMGLFVQLGLLPDDVGERLLAGLRAT